MHKLVEHSIVALIGALALLLSIYSDFASAALALLYAMHALYLLLLNYYASKLSISFPTSVKSLFLNADSRDRLRYYLSRGLGEVLYLQAYFSFLLFIAMAIASRDLETTCSAILLIVTANFLYSSISYFANSFLRSTYYAAIIVVALEVLGYATRNPYVSPLLLYPEAELSVVAACAACSVALFSLSAVGWTRLWSSKRSL